MKKRYLIRICFNRLDISHKPGLMVGCMGGGKASRVCDGDDNVTNNSIFFF